MPHHFRALALALALSLAVHAAVLVGGAPAFEAPEPMLESSFTARLVAPPPPPAAEAPPAPAPKPRARPRPRPPKPAAPPRQAPIAIAVPEPLPELAAEPAAEAELAPALLAEALVEAPMPDVVALAAPQAPPAPEPVPEASFPVEALPASVSIEYRLTSAFADGHAEYRWDREGDHYRIQGEARAEGFFTLFLEGSILQESRGTVTARGLRPDRFSEQRPDTAPEGLEFDWEGRRITFERNGEQKTSELQDNTVDWLSMIFQMAHVPPQSRDLELQVFTQRRLYRFHLKVLGVEEVEIPLGRVAALHLRHEDPVKKEVVDVWLGIDQHFLPVKLRFPAARNRIVVDQVATRVEAR